MRINKSLKPIAGISLMFATVATMAQEVAKEPYTANEILTNAMFWILSGTVIVLFFIITILASAVKKVAEFWNIYKTGIKTITIIAAILFSAEAIAQEVTSVSKVQNSFGGLTPNVFYLFLVFIAIELLIIGALYFVLKRLINLNNSEEELVPIQEVSILDKFNASVSIEDERDILLDHNYDGIKELDNSLPPWWKYGFYFTIVWGIAYLIYFHLGSGPSSEKEYIDEVELAQIQIDEYMKKSANAVDENNVTLATDAASLDAGKATYLDNCAACHGRLGEGGVGPNLTDDYWLHGGSINNIFKTIKYGVPEKGMKSWQAELSPSQIRQVASFIKSLYGTNPPNAKEKQGDLYIEEEIPSNEIQIDEYMKKSANAVDENNVTLATDAASLDAGKATYLDNCAACHGRLGEGGVGPNLTDDYWLYGGSINNIFKIIKYGVPEKGMKSWQAELSPSQIRQVASFIKSLYGTNPPNAKEKQGDLYIEEEIPSNETSMIR